MSISLTFLSEGLKATEIGNEHGSDI